MNYRVRHLKPIIGSVVILLFILLFLILWNFSDDQEEYGSMMKRVNAFSGHSEQDYHATQYRKGVQKEIWYKKDGKRLAIVLTGSDAKMEFDKQGEGNEIVEKLRDVQCWIQEELYYLASDGQEVMMNEEGNFVSRQTGFPVDVGTKELTPVQTVRFIEAESAIYSYQKENLAADNVHMSIYMALGHGLVPVPKPEKYAMKSLAESIEVAFSNRKLDVKANRLKTTMF